MIEKPIEFNSLTMNDRSIAVANLMVSPYYFLPVHSADGLFGQDIRVETHPNVCDIGESHGEPLHGGKQVVLSGSVIGRNLAELREGQLDLMEAFWDLQEHALKFYFSPRYAQLQMECYVNQPLVITDEIQKIDYWIQRWTVGLRADDPRMYYVSGGGLFQSWMS